jgi:hypothetical protein
VFECAVANRASRAATKVEDEENKVFWERMVPLALSWCPPASGSLA